MNAAQDKFLNTVKLPVHSMNQCEWNRVGTTGALAYVENGQATHCGVVIEHVACGRGAHLHGAW